LSPYINTPSCTGHKKLAQSSEQKYSAIKKLFWIQEDPSVLHNSSESCADISMNIWQFIMYNAMTFFHEKMQSRLNLPEKDLHGTATIFS